MTESWPEKKRLWLWVLGAAAILYAVFARLQYVGGMDDDSAYILAAKSLLSGHYVNLALPGPAVAPQYPPGYPAFLAPFVLLLQPHWDALKCVSLALSLLNVCLAWELYRDWLAPWPKVLALVLFALNPATICFSGMVISETLYISVTLLSFLALRKVLSQKTSGASWTLGLLLGYAPLVRLPGLVLIPPVLVALLYAKRRKEALQAAVVALALVGSYFLWSHSVSGRATGESALWSDSWMQLSNFTNLLDNAIRLTYIIFVQGLMSLTLPFTRMGMIAAAVITAGIWACFVAGSSEWSSRSARGRALFIAIALYAGALFGLHVLFHGTTSRYALPLLPFTAGFFLAGYERLSRSAGGRSGLLILGTLWAGLTVQRLIPLLGDKPSVRQVSTWAWIASNTPPSSNFMTPKVSEIFLSAGRHSAGVPFARDAEEMRYRALAGGFTHVLARPANILDPRAYRAWRLNQTWVAEWPRAFKRVYENPGEFTAVYEIIDDGKFMAAYELYLSAREDLGKEAFDDGFKKLENALARYPHLVSALNAYGAAAAISRRNLKTAEIRLKEVLEVRPGHALAMLNLARCYRAMGRDDLAEAYLRKARDAAGRSLEFDYLAPAIAAAG